MASQIEDVTTIRTETLVAATSRYLGSSVIYYGDAKKITFRTYKRPILTESSNDKVAVIPPGMEFRPDLVSRDAYGTTDFWWKIMEANNISDIFEFKSGKTIRIPDSLF